MTETPTRDALKRTLYNAKVWTILVEECGADADYDEFYAFDAHWPECREYRFMGNQGFGGKIWAGHGSIKPVVTCYQEDDNAERMLARTKANVRLSSLGVSNV